MWKMIIDKQEYLSSVLDILYDLKSELNQQNIDLLSDIKDGPDNVMITCPYHSEGHEHRPSMGVKKDSGICHCFTCGKVVSLQDLVSDCFKQVGYGDIWLSEHYDFVTMEQTKNMFDDLADKSSKQYDDLLLSKLNGTYVEDESGFVSEEELDSYRWTHPYWAKRGITEDWVIELFDLGYDKEKQMITMPVRDIQGRCEFVAKRSVNTKFFQYPPGVSKPLYGLYEFYKSVSGGRGSAKLNLMPVMMSMQGKIFVCESMIDCILLWQYGHYAVALNGLGNNRQFQQLNELPVNCLVLCTDNDEAGQNARARIRKNVRKLCSEIQFPKGIKDVGECSPEQIENIRDWEIFV